MNLAIFLIVFSTTLTSIQLPAAKNNECSSHLVLNLSREDDSQFTVLEKERKSVFIKDNVKKGIHMESKCKVFLRFKMMECSEVRISSLCMGFVSS